MPISIVPTKWEPSAYGSRRKQNRKRKKSGKRRTTKTGYGDKLVSKQYGGKIQ
jgi:hypothetical protein